MNIVYQTILILNSDKFYGTSREIEIAKGKNKLCKSWKERKEQIKRRFIFLFKK